MIIRLQIFPHSSLPPNPKSHRTHVPFKPFRSTTPTNTSTTTTSTDAGLLFHEKIIYLQTLNINPTKALHINPNLRSTPLSSIQSVEHCLSSMGIESSAHGRILDMLPTVLTFDPYLHLYPILDFLLNDVQIPYHDVRKCIIRCPRILLCDVEKQLKPTLEFLKKLGFVEENRITCQTTLLLVSNVEHTLMPKIAYLMDLGFDFNEVANMVLRSPALLTYSIENNYRPKVEYFLEEMNGDIRELKRFPQYFSFSLEGKIKCRHRSLVEHGVTMSLPQMLKVSDGEFNSRLTKNRLRFVDQRLL